MSPRVRRIVRNALALALLGLASLLAPGCATTHAYQREHLADPIMSFDAEARGNARMMKMLEAREGSTGGIGGAGGGCACK
ncbi:MAG TPA: DUF4266 domain-containing protein [Candidatus Acidoferrales bacterium]|nr:DUF4266 domain-containing protein [Candidatus Acidoferrales bacterium]